MNDELINNLLNRLILTCLRKEKDEIPSEKMNSYNNYFRRLLNSEMKPISTQESNIIAMIIEKLPQDKNSRFQTLYSRLLLMKNKITRRWAVLYCIMQIGKEPDDLNHTFRFLSANSSQSKQISPSVYIRDGSLVNKENIERPRVSNTRSVNTFENPNVSRLVVLKNKTNKIITERDIIGDLIYVFQGIDGSYIHFNSQANAFVLNPLIPFKEDIFEIVGHLGELGWLYKKTQTFLEYFDDLGKRTNSQTLEAFTFAIKNELNEYYK